MIIDTYSWNNLEVRRQTIVDFKDVVAIRFEINERDIGERDFM